VRVEAVLALLRGAESAAELARWRQAGEMRPCRSHGGFPEIGRCWPTKGTATLEDSSALVERIRRELANRALVIGDLTLANDLARRLQVVST